VLHITLESVISGHRLKKGGVVVRNWIIVLGLFLVTLVAVQGSLAVDKKERCDPPPCAIEMPEER